MSRFARHIKSVLTSSGRFWALFAAVAILALGTAGARAQPSHVYVFNGGANNDGYAGDPFTANAQGWIFQSLGLLGANGEPPTVDGDNLKQGDTVVGTVIRDGGGAIIGYQSADGTKRAYNVDKTTTATAWSAVRNGGTLTIAKHGILGGGGVTLDGGTAYDGFTDGDNPGGGTGAGNEGGAYPLPPRPGAGISVDVNSCNSNQDPDGAGPQTPVTGSAGGVPGVGATSGQDGVVHKNVEVSVGGTPAQKAAAKAKLKDCAKKAGFKGKDGTGDVGAWVAAQPFPNQHQAAKDCIAGTGATVKLVYGKSPACTPGSGPGGLTNGCYYLPITRIGPGGGLLHYEASSDHFIAAAQIFPGTLMQPTPMFISPLPLPESVLPPGTFPATYCVSVGRYHNLTPIQFFQPVQLMLQFDPTHVPAQGFFRLIEKQLQPHPAQINPNGTIMTQLFQPGTYVALGPMPPPTPCEEDLDGDGVVGQSDLAQVLSCYNVPANDCGDVDGDGETTQADLAAVLALYNAPCP